MPNRQRQPEHPTALPVRILLVSPRPEKDAKGIPWSSSKPDRPPSPRRTPPPPRPHGSSKTVTSIVAMSHSALVETASAHADTYHGHFAELVPNENTVKRVGSLRSGIRSQR